MTESSDQLESLRALVGALLSSNPFYGARLRATGMDAPPDSIEAFCRSVPLTSKAELIADQASTPPFGTNLTYPLEDYTRFCQTSGTTGQPMIWLDTGASWQTMLEQWKRVYAAAGCERGERVFFAFSFGPFLGFWTAFGAAAQLDYLCIPGGGMSSAARLRVMGHVGATTLCCTPTYALRLAQVARDEGIDAGALGLKRIIVAGEPGGSIPTTRQQILESYPGATVLDHHGMTEVGPVSFEDPAHPMSLRVMSDAFLVEVIDPTTLEPVGAGVEGELVLTTLKRLASPLLRYRTGDLVKQSREDASLLEGGVLGRVDDMVVVRGVNVYPSAVERIVRGHRAVVEYRATVSRANGQAELALEVECEPGASDGRAACELIEAELRHALQLRVPVKEVASETLPRFEMKAKRWVVADA